MSIQSFVQTYRGSSFPTLARLEDGRDLIIKLRGSGNGVSCLLAEYIVNKISSHMGLPVPDAHVVALPEGFPWVYGTDEFDDIVQKSFGLNLGIDVIPDARPWNGRNFSELDRWSTLCMLAIDLLFLNVDRSLGSQNILQGAQGQVWLIDHGSCLFLRAPSLPRDRLPGLACLKQKKELKGDIRSLVKDLSDPDRLADVLQSIPEEWLQHEGWDAVGIQKRISTLAERCFTELLA